MAYKPVSLFGGSIVSDLPNDFADVSEIRQVPDNQEVYLEQNGYTSITFDILESVNQPDLQALEYHLHDIVEEDADETKIISTAAAHLSSMPPGTDAMSLVAVSPAGEKQRSQPKAPEFVAIFLLMIRLPKQKTDILVVINVPYIPGEYDAASVKVDAAQFGQLGERAQQIRDKILQTFNVNDWSLFVNED